MMQKVVKKFVRPVCVFIILFIILFISSCSDSKNNSTIFKIFEKQILTNWYFQIDVFDIGEKEKWFASPISKMNWNKVKVPNAWDTYDESLWGYEGIGWYATTVHSQLLPKNKIFYLKFNRVNYYTKVWINGIKVGENIGGYLPFMCDISKYLNKNDNQLVIRVDNKPRLEWLPASKQIEWVQYGGILQPVELVVHDSIYIEDLAIHAIPNGEGASIKCFLKIANNLLKSEVIDITLRIPTDSIDIEKKYKINCPANTQSSVFIPFFVSNLKKWSPSSPKLYSLSVLLSNNKKNYDWQTYRFGIRSIHTKGHKILLNGEPIKIKGVNRYDIFDRRGPIEDVEEIRKDLLNIKKMGANTIRVHYPQSPLTLNLMDEIGLLLIEELPLNWWGQNWWNNEKVVQDTSILKQARTTLEKMIKRDKNHPCIIAWSLANESKTDTKVGTYVIKKIIKKVRSLDSTRLITFTVNNKVSNHTAFKDVDFISRNIYHGNNNAYHISMIDSMVRIPSENDIRNACNYYQNKPMIVSEFGVAGIKNIYGDVLFSEDYQAEYIKAVWKAISNVKECSGGILWSWSDYYHRKYFNQTYAPFGPYGVLNVNKVPKKSFEILSILFNEK